MERIYAHPVYEKRCRKGRRSVGYCLSDWANIHKTARAISRVSGGSITVKFYVEISCNDFDNSGELLQNNYAKETRSIEPTNIMKYTKNLKKKTFLVCS